jgi:hypothetical protein
MAAAQWADLILGRPDVLFACLGLNGGNGCRCTCAVRERAPNVKVKPIQQDQGSLLLVADSLASLLMQVAIEDHHWWWRSIFSGGCTGIFIFGYCIYCEPSCLLLALLAECRPVQCAMGLEGNPVWCCRLQVQGQDERLHADFVFLWLHGHGALIIMVHDILKLCSPRRQMLTVAIKHNL